MCQPLTRLDLLRARRLVLPARLYGCGLRSTADTAPAAFVGSLCRTGPMMIDRAADGIVESGFLSAQLSSVLGVGSFDEVSESLRFDTLLRSGSSLGRELASY